MVDRRYGEPIQAIREALVNILNSVPILWVGAGASVAAHYPSTDQLIQKMRDQCEHENPIPKDLAFTEVANRYVKARGDGALKELLQCELAKPRQPTEFHRAVAQLASAQKLHAIVTTNYDALLERALDAASVPHLVQSLNRNEASGMGFRVLKLHGSQDDWMDVILSGDSYAEFNERYKFLRGQLDALLRQHTVIFAGCSMTDPRILDWLATVPSDWAASLKPWRPMMLLEEWKKAVIASDGHGKHPLTRGNIRPLVFERHTDLPELWMAAADKLAPLTAAPNKAGSAPTSRSALLRSRSRFLVGMAIAFVALGAAVIVVPPLRGTRTRTVEEEKLVAPDASTSPQDGALNAPAGLDPELSPAVTPPNSMGQTESPPSTPEPVTGPAKLRPPPPISCETLQLCLLDVRFAWNRRKQQRADGEDDRRENALVSLEDQARQPIKTHAERSCAVLLEAVARFAARNLGSDRGTNCESPKRSK